MSEPTREQWQAQVVTDFEQMRRMLGKYEQLLGKLHPKDAYLHYRAMMEIMAERLVDRCHEITEHQEQGAQILKGI